MSFSKLSILFATCFLSVNVIAQFEPGISVATNALEVNEIRALDLDGDLDLDIVVRQPSAFVWLKNLGDGNFGALDTIYVSQGELGVFDFAVTQDNGGMDLVISDLEADTVLLLLNDGEGNFGAPIGLLGTESGVALNLANVTGSNLPDLVIHFDDGVYALENVAGNFSSAEFLGNGSTLIFPQFVWDIDADGDLDIVCFVGLAATTTFITNPGGSGGLWETVQMPFDVQSGSSFTALDLDGDGDLDLADVGRVLRWIEFEQDTLGIFPRSGPVAPFANYRGGGVAQLGCGAGASMLWTDSIGEPVQWATYDPVLGAFGPVSELPDLPSFRMIRSADLDADGHEDLILWHDDSLLTWHRNVLVTDTLAALNLAPFCYTGIPYISYELPTPGSWSGPGVIEVEFWAHTAGLGTHDLVRTVDHGFGCVVSTTEPVSVISDPVVEPDLIDVCTIGVVQFTADQPGGVWTGTSADGSLNTDTLVRPAYYSAQYRITDPAGATCSGSTVFNLYPIGHASVGPHGPFCESDPPQQFNVVGGGLLGSVFVENAPFLEVEVVTNYASSVIFDPSVGPGDYSFTVGMAAPMVCGQIDTITIVVLSGPEVTLSLEDLFCVNSGALALAAQGEPDNGSYFLDSLNNPVTELGVDLIVGSTHVVFYSYTDPISGCSNTATDTVLVDLCTGIEARSTNSLRVYPNPSKDGTVRLANTLQGTDLILYDATGRVLWQRRALGSNFPVEISGLASGMYRVVAIDVEGVQAIGVVVE